MLQLINHSPFSPAINVYPDEKGIDALYVVVKATFTFDQVVQLAELQIPPTQEDTYWGEPAQSSLKYANEMHLVKPATDIIVNGHAYAPDGSSTSQLDCGIKVGDYSKTIRVFGDRFWHGKEITTAKPFEKIPLIYENAFGGAYLERVEKDKGGFQQRKILHTANPLGRGYQGRGNTQPINAEKLPNLENPKQLIQLPTDKPKPVGFGFIAPGWKPRVDFAGTYDEVWQKKHAPYLPADFNNKFFNAAAQELIVPGYLKGGEKVTMVHLMPEPYVKFILPSCRLRCEIRISHRTENPDFNLETVLIEPDGKRFCMTWRAKLNCDKEMLNIREVRIYGDDKHMSKVA